MMVTDRPTTDVVVAVEDEGGLVGDTGFRPYVVLAIPGLGLDTGSYVGVAVEAVAEGWQLDGVVYGSLDDALAALVRDR